MKIAVTVMIIFVGLTGTPALAAEKSKTQGTDAKVTAEQRQNMAAVHESMAACLRSDKPMEGCRKDMMQSCNDMMGKNGCLMMGQIGKMHGAMGKGMMYDQGMMNQDQKKVESEKKQLAG